MTVAVSRLHWDDGTVPAFDFEIPHIRGVPVRATLPDDAEVHRYVPNRLGVAEGGSDSDTVHRIEDLDPDVARFRRLLRRLAQINGVAPIVDPEMACGVVLTHGVAADALAGVNTMFPGSVAPTPARLAEFPGGVQIVANPSVASSFDSFADSLEQCLRGGPV